MNIKKTIILPVGPEEIQVDVNFSIIEKVERVYNCTAEIAAATHLIDLMRIRRSHIAQIICLWVQGKTELTYSAINEEVQTCSQKQLLKYAGMIQAAVLYSIRGEDGRSLITDEQFDKLCRGEDLTEEDLEKGENTPPAKKPKAKKKTGATSRKRTS